MTSSTLSTHNCLWLLLLNTRTRVRIFGSRLPHGSLHARQFIVVGQMTEDESAQSPTKHIASGTSGDRTSIHKSDKGRVTGQCMNFSIGDLLQLTRQNIIFTQRIYAEPCDVLIFDCLPFAIVLQHACICPFHSDLLVLWTNEYISQLKLGYVVLGKDR